MQDGIKDARPDIEHPSTPLHSLLLTLTKPVAKNLIDRLII